MEALILDVHPTESPESLTRGVHFATSFMTTAGEVSKDYTHNMALQLADCSFKYAIISTELMEQPEPEPSVASTYPFAFIMNQAEHYSSKEFYDILIDTGAAMNSTAGYAQYQAYNDLTNGQANLNRSTASQVKVQFGSGSSISSIGSIVVNSPVGDIEFHIVETNTPFLLSLHNMDRLKVYLNNVSNLLITPSTTIPVVRRFGHPFLLWKDCLNSFITVLFNSNPCFLTDTELRQLHRRFGHPSSERLYQLLHRAGHEDVQRTALKKLTKFCTFCQKYGKSPGRFKFNLRDNVEFNYSIIVNIMYIDNSPILHVVDESTRFQAAR